MTQTPERHLSPAGLSLSPAMEDYIKTIFRLSRDHDTVSTQALADRMEVAPASVTRMLKRLSDCQLVAYEPYRGVRLTEAGRKVALEILRHHRLLELYLTQALGYSWDEVHDEAELLEHFISEKLEARIAEALGHPSFDPHGSPIPTLEGEIPESVDLTLALQELHRPHEVTRVRDGHSDILRELADNGIYPGVTVSVLGRPPGGSCHLKVGRRECLVSPRLCEHVRTCPTDAMRLTADQMQAGERAEVYRLRGAQRRRLEAAGLDAGKALQRRQDGYHAESGPLDMVDEQARDIIVTLGAG